MHNASKLKIINNNLQRRVKMSYKCVESTGIRRRWEMTWTPFIDPQRLLVSVCLFITELNTVHCDYGDNHVDAKHSFLY